VVDLAHRVDSTVCAEGVETVEDLRSVMGMGCDTAQGFLFAKPLPPDAFASEATALSSQWAARRAFLIKRSDGGIAAASA
jgi:EAL domain-containing protein (putative c-di-GMP-specific phosphodiesterase class I)